MNEKFWFVVRQKRVWEFSPSLNGYSWVEIEHKRITPNRQNKIEAENDFNKLGFYLNYNRIIQYNDNIIPQKTWIRYIIQCGK